MKQLALVVLLLTAFTVSAAEMTVTIPVDASAIEIKETGPYTIVTGIGMRITGEVGAPSLPVYTEKIALPTGCAATGIEIIDAEYTDVRGGFTLIPSILPIPLSVDQEIQPLQPNP
ncbi:MAG: hypothetical protein KAQ97_07475, partial [Candidatus Fermentibacteraceae bacterium]|nr:hypothetical protein [Candidatus Fermentibacteraceae bacterium]